MSILIKKQKLLPNTLVTYRWWLVAAIIFGIVSLELIEHFGVNDSNWILILELIFIGFLFPLLIGVILSALAIIKKEQLDSSAYQAQRENISHQIMAIDDWGELQDLLIRFPQKVAPVIAVSFLIKNQLQQNVFTTAAEWRHKNYTIEKYPKNISIDEIEVFITHALHKISAKQHISPPLSVDDNGYCLPFIISGAPVGLLHLHFPNSYQMSSEIRALFNDLSPVIAFAIANLAPTIFKGERSNDPDLRRFARYLHDTVGQNLGYLILKLDGLHAQSVSQIDMPQEEIVEMRDVANKTYEQVRNILDAMQPPRSVELSPTLYQMAITIANRQPSLHVKMTSDGQSHRLSSGVLNVLVAIFREAILNVVKHANADNINLKIVWREDSLTIELHDDGDGFLPEKISQNSHGLQIMFEQASEIDAQLSIESGLGTSISLNLPV